MPNLSFGKRVEVRRELTPDIGEQSELARHVSMFLDNARYTGYMPDQRDRQFRDIRTFDEAGNPIQASFSYSEGHADRLAAEIGLVTQDSAVNYTLIDGRSEWERAEQALKGRARTAKCLAQTSSLIIELNEAINDTQIKSLLDVSPEVGDVIDSLRHGIAKKARSKSGVDTYRIKNPIHSDIKGYDFDRDIVLIDHHNNRRVEQKLAVSALIQVSDSSDVRIRKSVEYHVAKDNRGKIIRDGVQIVLSSTDGLSEASLRSRLDIDEAENSTILRYLYDGLTELKSGLELNTITKEQP